jgi:hypothetical protein
MKMRRRSTGAARKEELLDESSSQSLHTDYASKHAEEAQLQPKKQDCLMSLVQPEIALFTHKKVQKKHCCSQNKILL